MYYRIFETWRLMAAVSIMLYHFLRFGPPEVVEMGVPLIRFMPLMEMFFMISGYLIMERYGASVMSGETSFRRYILRRLARIYPLYFATLVFFCLVALALDFGLISTDNRPRFDWSALLANVLLLQAWGLTEVLTFNYVAWSLSSEWLCYLLFPVIVLAFRYAGATGIAVVTGATVVALEIGVAIGLIPFESWLEATTWGAYRAFAGFAIGALLSVIVRASRSSLSSQAPAWIAFALAVLAMDQLWNGYAILGLLALAMYFAAIAERNRPRSTDYLLALHPVAKVALGIYLLHPVVETVLLSLVWRSWIEPLNVIGFLPFLIVPSIAVIVLSMLSERYFERPVGRFIAHLGEGRREAGDTLAAPAK